MTPDTIATSRRRIIFAAAFGNFLEFFDFTVFTTFALIIANVFFPSSNPASGLMKALAVYGAGFFMRPVGGIIIGYYADHFGRKSAMILTLSLMTLSTLGVACSPGAATAGVWGAVMLIGSRLLQGFAAGGEVGASTSMLVESAPSNRRGLYSSWQLATQGISTMLGGLLSWALNSSLSPETMVSWGWRVPFLIGAALGPVGLYMRLQIEHSVVSQAPAVAAAAAAASEPKPSAWTLLREHINIIIVGVLLTIGGTITVYLTWYYYAILAGGFLKIPAGFGGAAIGLAGLVTAFMSPLGGYLSDLYGRKPVVLWTRVALAILTLPSYWLLINYPTPGVLLLIVAVMASLTSMGGAPLILMTNEVFPRVIRALAFSIVYSVGVTIFGGFAQFFATGLITITGSLMSPSLYLIGGCVVTFIALRYIDDQYKSELK